MFKFPIQKVTDGKKALLTLIAEQKILNRIYVIRGEKAMLDPDLAAMYGVETRRLNEQVKRNLKRFPKDFMFTLTTTEFKNLKSQFATSSLPGDKPTWGGRRTLPHAFTEQVVAMLSSIMLFIYLLIQWILLQKPYIFNEIRCRYFLHPQLSHHGY